MIPINCGDFFFTMHFLTLFAFEAWTCFPRGCQLSCRLPSINECRRFRSIEYGSRIAQFDSFRWLDGWGLVGADKLNSIKDEAFGDELVVWISMSDILLDLLKIFLNFVLLLLLAAMHSLHNFAFESDRKNSSSEFLESCDHGKDNKADYFLIPSF